MNTQRIKLFVMSLMLTAMPMLAATAQVSMNLNDGSLAAVPVVISQSTSAANSSTHTIALNEYGGIVGQVASIDQSSRTATGLSGLDIFFVRDGEILEQAQTNAQGDFEINGLEEGAYSFYAAGKNGLAAYGVYVTSEPQAASQNILEAVTASTSNRALEQLIQNGAPAEVAQSLQNAIQSVSQGTEVQTNKQIRLINGRLYGQISTLFSEEQSIAGVPVQLIQGTETIAQVETDADGAFSIPDVEPGVYDYIIGGTNGFAAGSLEAVGNTSSTQQVAFRRTITQLDACLTCPNSFVDQPVDFAQGQDTFLEPAYADTTSAPIEYAGESVSYGGASGGCCGASNVVSNFDGGGIVRGRFGLQGGGACCNPVGGRLGGRVGGRLGGLVGGGNGGFSRLLSIAGLGVAVVAIADDDPDDASDIGN